VTLKDRPAVKPLNDQERKLAEAAARLIATAAEVGLSDPPDKLGVTPHALVLIARAYTELCSQVMSLTLADPNAPIGKALAIVGLERRPSGPSASKPLLTVKSPAQVTAMRADELLAIYCAVMRETASVFVKYETYVVRHWDGMDGCWTDCTGDVGQEEALRYWAERTDGGSHQVDYAEIDYYRIFPGGKPMHWDGSEGREMHR
jgi:hypothetical protein